jgi:YegS/Rv2252/BmrU family lipid kinase
MYASLGDLVIAVTEKPSDVADHVKMAYEAGWRRVIAVGGDGTSHALVNALLALDVDEQSDDPMIFGQLPVGTGQDFARSLQIPNKLPEAIRWLASAEARPVDVGHLRYDGGALHFLNIASAGVSGDVDRRVGNGRRYPWTFWLASVQSLLRYQKREVRVHLDGALWYEGRVWMVVVANGAWFGRGMAIAPDARINDGLFDVVLVKDAPRLTAVRAFNTVYSGKHLARPEVELRRGKQVEIEVIDGTIPLDLDGEPADASHLTFSVRPSALQMLYAADAP